jgi:hypothetical protein
VLGIDDLVTGEKWFHPLHRAPLHLGAGPASARRALATPYRMPPLAR